MLLAGLAVAVSCGDEAERPFESPGSSAAAESTIARSPQDPRSPTPAAAATAGATRPSASATATDLPASPSSVATVTPTMATTPTGSSGGAGPASHDGDRTLGHVRYLSETIGPRVSGSAAEQSAVSYIRGEFEAAGYSVELIGFDFEGDRYQSATVMSGATQVPAVALAGSRGGTASGKAIYVGLADAAGIGGKTLAGAIAVADRGTLRFAEKYDNVRAAGAIGLVIANNDEGMFSGDLQKPADFPVVAIARADGIVMRATAAAGGSITIDSPATSTTHSVDVVARASPDAACRVLVGGHHDTVASAPGANDNASGAATVLELARAFAADGLDAGLCFATFGGEESGLHGSQVLVGQMRGAGALPTVMVNLDVTGIGARVAVIGSPDPVQRALRLANQLGIPALAADLPAGTGSDHQSFRDAGVPVVFFTSGEFANIHSPRDVVGAVDVAELDRVGDLAYATIRDLLGAVAPP